MEELPEWIERDANGIGCKRCMKFFVSIYARIEPEFEMWEKRTIEKHKKCTAMTLVKRHLENRDKSYDFDEGWVERR